MMGDQTQRVSAPQLAIDDSAIDDIFRDWDNTRNPGYAVGIYNNGRLAFARGYGMANLELGVPITPRSIFHVASVSKQFTDMCIAILAAEGKLSPDDEIHTYVPEVPDFGAPITLRHLIHHTSGIRDQWSLLEIAGWRDDDLITESDVLDVLGRQTDLNFPPGEKHLYCNTGYTLLALTVHRVTGQTLREFAHERNEDPLGMTSTHFHDNHREIVPGRTQAYETAKDGGWEISIPVFDVVGTTSLHTTVEDLQRWYQNFIDPVVGGPEVIDQLLTPGRLNDGTDLDYAWGLALRTYRGASVIEHSGADAGYRAHFMRFPDHDLGIAVLANFDRSSPVTFAERVADAVLGDALEPAEPGVPVRLEPDPAATSDISRLAGVYRQVDGDDYELLSVSNNTLKLGWHEPWDFVRVDDRAFRLARYPSWSVSFASGASEPISYVRRFGTEKSNKTFVRVEPPALTADDLIEFAGAYTCAGVGTTYELRLAGGELRLRRRKFDPSPVHPVAPDIFVTEAFFGFNRLRFFRDDAGKVTHFTLGGGRVLDLVFTRDDGAKI